MPSTSDSTAKRLTRIVVTFKSTDKLLDVTGYLVTSGDKVALVPASDLPGRFAFPLLRPGTYDLILEAKRQSEDTTQEPQLVAVRLSGVEVKADKDTFVRDVELVPYHKLSGHVKLLDGTTQAGIQVAIPDTPMKVQTAADGSYQLEKVPQGLHSLLVTLQGQTDGMYDKRLIKASEELNPLTLLPPDKSLATGIHYLDEPLPPQAALPITLFLQRPQGMNLFRWGFTADLANAPWLPYQSSYEFRLPADQRTIHVQFSKDRQQVSAPYSIQLPSQ
jgi:hypothetical protein